MSLKSIMRIINYSILSLSLTACSTYRSSFSCEDAKGVYCASMDRVDRMVSSGEIERFNEKRKENKRYKVKKNDRSVTAFLKKSKLVHLNNKK